MPETPTVSIHGRWKKLDGDRSQVLERARECAKITIPQLMPPSGSGSATKFNTPWQALGARGVNNLASKLILALFPPNQAFFRLKLDDEVAAKISQDDNAKTVVETGMSKMENDILEEIEGRATRMAVFEAAKHLVVTGNSLIFIDDEGAGLRVYRLDQYCVKRDPMGNVLEIITKESISPLALPADLRALVTEDGDTKENPIDQKPVDLFTRVVRGDGIWEISQEINSKEVPSSAGTYPLDKSPFIPLRWSALAGEDYGRGLVEEYLGDLKALEELSKAIIEGSAAAAKLLVMVNPNGTTRISKIANAANLDMIEGNAEDVSFLQVEKFNDFRVALETIKNLEQRLAAAFMLNTSVQRDGERVTAEEIRYMARELEDALGGVYSVLGKELQLPIVSVIQFQMTREGKLPKLPEGKVKLTIVTGLEALGRSHELVKLNTWMQEVNVLGPDVVAPYIFVSEYIARVSLATGVDQKGLVRSEEEVMQKQAEAQKAAADQETMGNVIKSGAAANAVKGMMESGNAANLGAAAPTGA